MNKFKFKVYKVNTIGVGVAFSLLLGFTLTFQLWNRNFAIYWHDKTKVRHYLAGISGDFS
jgi:hypothetical protein